MASKLLNQTAGFSVRMSIAGFYVGG